MAYLSTSTFGSARINKSVAQFSIYLPIYLSISWYDLFFHISHIKLISDPINLFRAISSSLFILPYILSISFLCISLSPSLSFFLSLSLSLSFSLSLSLYIYIYIYIYIYSQIWLIFLHVTFISNPINPTWPALYLMSSVHIPLYTATFHLFISLPPSPSLSIYIYICVCVCVCVCTRVYVYVYIYMCGVSVRSLYVCLCVWVKIDMLYFSKHFTDDIFSYL